MHVPYFTAVKSDNGSLYLPSCATMLHLMIYQGLIDRRFRGLYQTECQRGAEVTQAGFFASTNDYFSLISL